MALKKIATGIIALTSSIAIAGTMGPLEESFRGSAYIKIGSGGSFSNTSHLEIDPLYWDESPQGYNSTLGDSALFSLAFGYNFSPLVSVDVDYTYRPSFTYSKFQTSSAAGTINFNGTKTRYFDLQTNTFLANMYLHGQGVSPSFVMHAWNNVTVQPFIGAGLGVSYNKISRFYSIRANDDKAVATGFEKTNASFAWQASAGIEVALPHNFDLAIGYRYFDGGDYKSDNNTFDAPPAFATPWKGSITANEVLVTLAYKMYA